MLADGPRLALQVPTAQAGKKRPAAAAAEPVTAANKKLKPDPMAAIARAAAAGMSSLCMKT